MKPLVLHVQKVAGISGSEAHLLALLPRLRERGVDVRFLMLHENEPGAWQFAGELESRSIPVDDVRLRMDADVFAAARVVSRVRAMRPHIVHTHLVHADVFGQLAAAAARTPVRISTKHGFNEFRDSRLFALADRLSVAATDAHIAISRGLAAYLAAAEGFAEARFTIIHYGIDAGPAQPAPYPNPPSHLVCVGRLIPIKGHEILLRAFATALRERDDLVLELAGSGPLERQLREQAQELGIDRSIVFHGHVSPIQPLLERAAAVVVPSLGEGFGMVALEAMERERPVIASAVGGLPEIVRDGETGIVVAPGDADALAQALLAITQDRERAASFGRGGRARALEHFSQLRCTERTLLVYEELLARHFDHSRSTAIAASSASTKSHGTR